MSDFTTYALENMTVIRLPERVDFGNVKAFIDALHRSATEGRRCLVLDLEGTHTLDSTALGAIAEAFRKSRDRGGAIMVAGPSQRIRRTLMLTRLDRFITVCGSVLAAIESQRSAASHSSL